MRQSRCQRATRTARAARTTRLALGACRRQLGNVVDRDALRLSHLHLVRNPDEQHGRHVLDHVQLCLVQRDGELLGALRDVRVEQQEQRTLVDLHQLCGDGAQRVDPWGGPTPHADLAVNRKVLFLDRRPHHVPAEKLQIREHGRDCGACESGA